MKLHTSLIIIFKIFWIFIINKQFNQCFAYEPSIKLCTNNNITAQQYTKIIQKKFYCPNNEDYEINKNNNFIDSIYTNKNIKNQIVLISSQKDPKYFLLPAYNHCYPKSHIQLKNDMLNIWYGIDKYSKNIFSQKISFMQLGIQNLLSNQTIILGYGTRYEYSNQYMIGYNAVLQSKIFDIQHQPYVMNLGLEYWYKNLLIKLNSYTNIIKIIKINPTLMHSDLQHPTIGYQISAQSKLPYLTACSGQITWENFFYKDIKNEKIFKNVNYHKQYVSLTINYNPIPMLTFSIDKTFLNNKSNNTVFKVILDYQFNVPILQQIQYIQYNNKSTISKNIDSIIEPFIGIPINIYDMIISSLQSTYEIIGYPGEIKIFKIGSDNQSSQILNDTLLKRYKGKIVHLKNNFYAIQLPEHIINPKNDIYFTYKIKNSDKKYSKNYKVLISTTKFQSINTLPNITNNHINVPVINNDTINDNAVCIQDIQTNQHTLDLQNTTFNTPIFNNTQELSVNHQTQDMNSPVPPPFPIKSLFIEKNDDIYANSDISKVYSQELLHTQNISKKLNDSVLLNVISNTNDPRSSNMSQLKDQSNDDLFTNQLITHKQQKFASINTPEYINKIEQSIKNRKQNKYTSDIGQKLNTLFKSTSSSTEESLNSDNNSNNSFDN